MIGPGCVRVPSNRFPRAVRLDTIDGVNFHAEIDDLLRSTDDAFRTTLHAVLDADEEAARGVLRGSAERRALLFTAQHALRRRRWVPAPQLASELQFVADIGRIGELVDALARRVIEGRRSLGPVQRLEVSVLLDAGGRRLRQLRERPAGPGLDPAYRGCGCALFEVADRAARDRSMTVVLCADLAAALLQASRHAARAA
jgi:hypothetical protein